MCSAKQKRIKLIRRGRVSFHVVALISRYIYLGRLYCYIHSETILKELVVHRRENGISGVVGRKESVSQGSSSGDKCPSVQVPKVQTLSDGRDNGYPGQTCGQG